MEIDGLQGRRVSCIPIPKTHVNDEFDITEYITEE